MHRILVVEDSPTQSMQLQMILEDEGFRVTAAADAEAALGLFDPGKFDLIVSDIMLPGMSGYDLCQKIKFDRRGRDVPFILLSTLSDAMDIVRGLECGADNFVTKPYEPDQLVARIRTVLDNRRIRAGGMVKLGIEVVFLGKRISITSEKEQILDLLMATFEDTVRANRGLQESKAELAAAKAELEHYASELERRVEARTKDLQERQRQLSHAQAIAHIGDWRWAVGSDQVDMSQEMRRICGLGPAGVPRYAGFLQMVDPADRAALTALIDRAVLDGTAFHIELRIRPEGAGLRYCWVEAECETDAAGRVIALIGICQDITDRKLAELAFQESNERYRQLVESAPDAIFVLRDGIITFANSAAERLFNAGGGARHLTGLPLLDLVHAESRDAVEAQLAELAGGQSQLPALDAEFLSTDGSSVEVVVTWSTFEQNGQRAVQAIAHDVSTWRSMQRQLHQAQKMEAVGQLTGGLAHDFNNLLTIIIGNLDILLDQLADMPDQKSLGESALTASLRGAELTRQLLAFSRRQDLRPKPINVNEVVGRMMTLLRRTLGEKVRIEIKAGEGLWVAEADPAQVETALANLAINARDAMPDGGLLMIETGNKRLDEAYAMENVDVAPGDYVMLAVTDTGIGIPPDVLPRVFEPFFTTKEVGKGTGLGLSMIYGFAKQSGGHVKIYSEPGHGTTVRLYLPRSRGDLVQPSEQLLDGHQLHGEETILVVEDNPEVRVAVVRQLMDHGYKIVESESAAEALQQLEAHPEIDLLFTDIVMRGGISGRELAIEARRRRPELRILLTSGFTEATIRDGNGQGALDGVPLLSKPYRKQELARKIREVLTARA